MAGKQVTLEGEIQTRLVNQTRTDNWDVDIGRTDNDDSLVVRCPECGSTTGHYQTDDADDSKHTDEGDG